ncbi:MAG: hypothetical protein RL177_768 [Bacteroidota bacterium]
MDFQSNTNVIQSAGLIYGGAPWTGLNYQIGAGLVPAGDINGDNKADMMQRMVNVPDISTAGLEDNIPVLHLVFTGNLTAPTQTITDVFSINPVGDIDGDGFGDAVVQPTTGVNSFVFYFGSPNGYVPSTVGFQLGFPISNLVTGDFDNNGSQDVMVLAGGLLHLINGRSNRAELGVLPIASTPDVITDLRAFRRHDAGRDHLAVTRFVANAWRMDIAKMESGNLSVVQSISGFPTTLSLTRWVFADLNGDTHDDLAVVFSNGQFAWAPASVSPDGNLFGAVATIATGLSAVPAAFHSDITGDGSADIVLTYNNEVYAVNGATVVANGLRVVDLVKLQHGGKSLNGLNYNQNRTSARRSHNTFGDVTGDGTPDLLALESVLNPNFFKVVAISSVANEGVNLNAPIREPREEFHLGANAGDWDNDGLDDYGYAYNDFTAANSRYRIVLSGGGQLSFDFAPDFNFYGVPAFGDIDGDGKSDMILRVRRLINGSMKEFVDIYSAASTTKTDKVTSIDLVAAIPSVTNPIITGFHNLGDMNGDGRDHFVAMPSGGFTNARKTVMLSQFGSTYQFNEIIVGQGNSAVNIGDNNGDGVDDFAMYDFTTDNIKFFEGVMDLTAGHVFNPINAINSSVLAHAGFAPVQVQNFGFRMVSGDFDGNGYTDLVVGAWQSGINQTFTDGDYILWLFEGNEWGLDPSAPTHALKISSNDLDPLRTFMSASSQFMSRTGLLQTLPDLNGDGSDELLVMSYLGSNALILLGGLDLGEGFEEYGAALGDEQILLQAPNRQTQLGHQANLINYRDFAALGDFDKDGTLELILPQPFDGNFRTTPVYKYILDIEPRELPALLEITRIEDVENDQGGWVRVHMDGLVFDLFEQEFGGGTPSWSLWRKNAASQWVHVTTIPYTFTLNTARYAEVSVPRTLPHGATPDDANSFVFKATLNLNYTDIDDMIVESSEVRGWALDNIAPAKIPSFMASVTESQVHLEWTPSFASDLRHYAVHAMVGGVIDHERPIAVTPEISITLPKRDMMQYGENVQLVVVAMDIHNNASAPSTGVTVPTSIDDDQSPNEFALSQNFPNPFNPSTVIGYQLSVSGPAKLTVFDVLGREIAVLVDGVMPAGSHTVNFDAVNLTSGMYVYRLEAGGKVLTRKMTLVK